MSFLIEPAQAADARGVALVSVMTWQQAYRTLMPQAYLAGLPIAQREAGWREWLANPAQGLWVARQGDGQVLGFVAFSASRDADALPHTGEVVALYVLPAHANQGIGKRLLHAAQAELAAAGHQRCTLWALVDNIPALAFYAGQGYVPDPDSGKAFELGEATLHELRLQRQLVAPAVADDRPAVAVLAYTGCLLAELAPALEWLGPHCRIDTLTPDGSPHSAANGLHLQATGSFSLLRQVPYRAVLVPGGDPDLLVRTNAASAGLQAAHAHGAVLAGICAGSLVLARAGLLAGRRGTHNYTAAHTTPEVLAATAPFFEGLQFEPADVVVDGPLITANHWAAEAFAGAVAQALGLVDAAGVAARLGRLQRLRAGLPSPAPATASAPAESPAATLRRVHHVAIICSDYALSRRFYTQVLGATVLAEHLRAERQSWKLDLALPDGTQIELFSFPNPPPRPSRPEAQGLRHLALAVANLDAWRTRLAALGVPVEPVRVDEYTGQRFTFFADPDGLPIELVETAD